MSRERLGLTDAEVDWLRANVASDESARALVRCYQMVVACPQDPGARGVFAGMLDDWRKARAEASHAG